MREHDKFMQEAIHPKYGSNPAEMSILLQMRLQSGFILVLALSPVFAAPVPDVFTNAKSTRCLPS